MYMQTGQPLPLTTCIILNLYAGYFNVEIWYGFGINIYIYIYIYKYKHKGMPNFISNHVCSLVCVCGGGRERFGRREKFLFREIERESSAISSNKFIILVHKYCKYSTSNNTTF